MELPSIVSLTARCVNLAKFTFEGIQAVHELKDSHRLAELSVSGLLIRIRSIRHTLSSLESWGRNARSADKELKICLECSIKDCLNVLTSVDSQVKNSRSASRSKFKNLWNLNVIRNYEQSLDSQISALQLLLNTTQLTNTLEQKSSLRSNDSRTVLRNAERAASAYEENLSSMYQGPEDRELEIDDVIINSTAYRAVFAKQAARNTAEASRSNDSRSRASLPSNLPAPGIVAVEARLSSLAFSDELTLTDDNVHYEGEKRDGQTGFNIQQSKIPLLSSLTDKIMNNGTHDPREQHADSPSHNASHIQEQHMKHSLVTSQPRGSSDRGKELALIKAIEFGSLDTVKKLLGQGVSANSCGEDGWGCLANAVALHPNRTDLVSTLLEHGADALAWTYVNEFRQSWNIFHILALSKSLGPDGSQIARELSSHYPNGMSTYSLNEKSEKLWTPLQAVCVSHERRADPLRQSNKRVLAQAFIELGADIHQPLPKASGIGEYINIFLWVCGHKPGGGAGTFELAQVLLQTGADISATSQNGTAALHLATRSDQPKLVALLLELGASVTATDSWGRTALHHAISAQVGELLLKSGASVNSKDTLGRTALHYASLSLLGTLLDHKANLETKDDDRWTPLHFKAHNDDVEGLKVLLDRGAFLEAEDVDNDSPLAIATTQSSINAVETLSAYGANMSTKNKNGEGLLHIAVRSAQLGMLLYWLEQGLDPNETDNKGNTPLHTACRYNNVPVDIVEALCKTQAHIIMRNHEGKTPLEYAMIESENESAKPERQKIVAYLEKLLSVPQ